MCYLKFENFLTKAEDRNNYDDVKVSCGWDWQYYVNEQK